MRGSIAARSSPARPVCMYLCLYVCVRGRIAARSSLALPVCMYLCLYVCVCGRIAARSSPARPVSIHTHIHRSLFSIHIGLFFYIHRSLFFYIHSWCVWKYCSLITSCDMYPCTHIQVSIHTMSHHHTCYVTSSYILYHIIIQASIHTGVWHTRTSRHKCIHDMRVVPALPLPSLSLSLSLSVCLCVCTLLTP